MMELGTSKQSITKRKSYKTAYHVRSKAKRRRARLSPVLEDGRRSACINENDAKTHGPATHGCRCDACHETHRRTR